ncbi:MAG: hypothetical protein AAF529_25180 [Pseudomonadota bacterium]
MARQESAIACRLLAKRVRTVRPKYPEHAGITAPSIDSGDFRAPLTLCMELVR